MQKFKYNIPLCIHLLPNLINYKVLDNLEVYILNISKIVISKMSDCNSFVIVTFINF